MKPLLVGTTARFDVISPSYAFRVETTGWDCPFAHSDRYPNGPGGTTVALATMACARGGRPQEGTMALTASVPENWPLGRVSRTRHGVKVNSDRPPGPELAGA